MNMQGYSSVQALSHATNKVRMYLPYSPCKQTAVVKTLGNSLINSDSLSDSQVRFPFNGNKTIGQ